MEKLLKSKLVQLENLQEMNSYLNNVLEKKKHFWSMKLISGLDAC